jgi:glycosyltransferase involved in cell wall biosynthesis
LENVQRQAECVRPGGKAGLRFSVGIPHYNRGAQIFRPLCNLLSHPAVAEVVIVDDGSSAEEFSALTECVRRIDASGRVRIHRREENRGALLTKLECAELSTSEWVLILDSDNTAFANYLDALSKLNSLEEPAPDTFYCAGWAFPYFPFHEFAGLKIGFDMAADLTVSGALRRIYIINDGNYLVHRDSYVRSVRRMGQIASDVADVMVVNYHWLSQGGCLRILPGTSYFHRVDASSFWCRTEEESRRRVAELFTRFEAGRRWDGEFHRSMSCHCAPPR